MVSVKDKCRFGSNFYNFIMLKHEHVSKRVKMHKMPTSGTNKHGKHIIARSGKREGYAQSNPASENASQVVTLKQNPIGVGGNHTTTNPLRALSMARPRTREASTEDKA